MKPGDLVWVEGHNGPCLFIGWTSDDVKEGVPHEYGVAYLLINGEVRREHNDWWVPWGTSSSD